MARQRPVGIDLGTTFSAAAWVDESGHTTIIRNGEGDLLTPSVVLFTDRETVVGKEARNAATVHPDLVAEWVKRDMGRPFFSRVIHGKKYPPEVIQACILRKLKEDIVRAIDEEKDAERGTKGDSPIFAKAKIGTVPSTKNETDSDLEVLSVVITVPAYFDEPRRKSTADAGEMAGLKVLDIVNEPTAAALAFGETLGYLTKAGVTDERLPQRGDFAPVKDELTLFVFDLGGGTFDATLLRLSPGNIQTLATDGDVQLGGHDWDLRLVEFAAARFERVHKLDPRQDPATMNRVLASAIDAKLALSARGKATIRVQMAGKTEDVPVTREQFEEMTADLLERTTFTAKQLLVDARLTWKDVDRLLLVGGSTRMPKVAAMLRELSGIVPDHTVNPDEAVARGAALYASYLLAKRSGTGAHADLAITNVNSHSLGVEGIDPDTLRKKNVVLLPRNSPLPAKVTERFVTKSENQRSIALQILEGENSEPSECTAIGRTVIRGLPEELPKNWPIEVTFEYGENGRLAVSAIVPGTHQSATLDLERPVGMSNEGIKQWKRPIGDAAGFDVFETIVQEELESAKHEGPPTQRKAGVAVELPPRQKESPTPRKVMALQADDTTSADLDEDFAAVELLPRHDAGVAVELPPQQYPLWSQQQAETVHSSPVGTPPASSSPVMPIDEAGFEGGDPTHLPKAKLEDNLPIPRWLFSLIGHIIAAILGLTLGYLILCWLRPEVFPLPTFYW